MLSTERRESIPKNQLEGRLIGCLDAQDGLSTINRFITEKRIDGNYRFSCGLPELAWARGMSFLSLCLSSGKTELARSLLRAGANVRMPIKEGTKLSQASLKDFPLYRCLFGCSDLISVMVLENDADLSQLDTSGCSMLWHAADTGQVQLATNILETDQKLQQKRSRPCKTSSLLNLPDSVGLTPLHVAALNGHLEMVQLLISHGADMSAAQTDGLTPLDMAYLHNHTRIMSLLLFHGAAIPLRYFFAKTKCEMKCFQPGCSLRNELNGAAWNYMAALGMTPHFTRRNSVVRIHPNPPSLFALSVAHVRDTVAKMNAGRKCRQTLKEIDIPYILKLKLLYDYLPM